MKKLTPVHHRIDTLMQVKYTKLNQDHTITLDEAKNSYKRLLNSLDGVNEEVLKGVNFDLTRYFKYEENGEPVYGSEEDPKAYDFKKIATYNPVTNCLVIWEKGNPIYENYNGQISRDDVALADNYL